MINKGHITNILPNCEITWDRVIDSLHVEVIQPEPFMSADYLVPTLRGKVCPNFWKGNLYEENLFTLFQIWRKPVPRLQSSKILHLKYNKKDIWKVWPATWSLKTFTQEHDVYTLQLILGAYTKVGGSFNISTNQIVTAMITIWTCEFANWMISFNNIIMKQVNLCQNM